MEWQACADEYAKLVKKMNTPRVVIDDAACPTATLVKVDSASRGHGILLDAIQGLTDLGLVIKKAYLSSDGPWFMDVFHVVDRRGLKLSDPSLLSLLESSLAAAADASADDSPAMDDALAGLTALELTGADRPGLLSEVFAVLRDLECNVVAAKAWTHNARTAALIFVKDHDSGCPIEEAHRVRGIEARLRNVLRGDHGVRGARTAVSPPSVTHLDRRLHQMMFADRDYERTASSVGEATSSKAAPVSVQSWRERGYSVVSVQCRDRPKLLFDVVCTLTDMEYVVFHGIIDTFGDRACQEFYIRHLDGSPISSEAERQRVIQCLQAAIERRASEGLRLELCTRDRRGLLAEVTRTFRENGLSVTRAEVTTREGMAVNEFYVTDTAGHLPDRRTINAVIEVIGNENLRLNEEHPPWPRGRMTRPPVAPRQDEEADGDAGAGAGLFSLGNLVMRNLYYLGLVRSCS